MPYEYINITNNEYINSRYLSIKFIKLIEIIIISYFYYFSNYDRSMINNDLTYGFLFLLLVKYFSERFFL